MTEITPEQRLQHERLVKMRRQAMAQPDGRIIEDWAEVIHRMPRDAWVKVAERRTRSAYQQLVTRLKDRFDGLYSRARTNPTSNMIEVWLYMVQDEGAIRGMEYGAPILGPPHPVYDAPYGENPQRLERLP